MDEKLQLLKKLDDDIKKYCRNCLKIRDKNGNIIAFVPNEHQERIVDIVEEWKKLSEPRPTLFIIILKARQIGFSTVVEAIFFHELHFNPNKVAMVISYEEDSAKAINDMSDRFYQYLPEIIRPMRRPSAGKGILFENPVSKTSKQFRESPGLQSKFLIETAKNENAGSSFTINYMHISELSKWGEHAKETLTSLLQAVPQYDGIVVIESSAKGINYFHKLWKQSRRGEINYKPIFVPWYEHKEYSKTFKNDNDRKELINTLTKHEKHLCETYEITYEQLNWRRDIIKTKCHGDESEFLQEYPHDEDTCFLTSGRPVFDRIKVQQRIKYLEEHYKKQSYDVGYIAFEDGEYKFVPDENGTIFIYEHPKRGYPYVIGGDIAEGLKNGDYTVSVVGDNTSGKIVAKQRLHIDPDLNADEQIKLANYYNQALIIDEINNHGHVTIGSLKRKGYYHQYKRLRTDKIHEDKEERFGFDTKEQSRQRIIDRLRAIVRDEIHLITDIEILGEMMTFIYNNNGKEEAEQDCFDDCVLATALMYEGRSQQRANPPKPEDSFGKNVEVHPSILQDTAKNPQLKEYYKKKYEQNSRTIKIGGR